ncbi:hypothetical protein MRX96_007562 [Rhipicephalus microplus]
MGVTKRNSDLLSDDRDSREKLGDIALNLAVALMSHMALTSEALSRSGAKEGGEWQTRAVRLTGVPHGLKATPCARSPKSERLGGPRYFEPVLWRQQLGSTQSHRGGHLDCEPDLAAARRDVA